MRTVLKHVALADHGDEPLGCALVSALAGVGGGEAGPDHRGPARPGRVTGCRDPRQGSTSSRSATETFPTARCWTLSLLARDVTARCRVPLVVNDRPDLALLAGANYVRLGQNDPPVTAARRLGIETGLPTHARTDIDASDADHIGVGPVFATPTKPGRKAVALELTCYAAAHAHRPWYAAADAENAAG